MELTVEEDYESMSQTAAEYIICFVKGSQHFVNVCLPTGRTPVRMYEILSEYSRKHPSTFQNVNWFTLDEYADDTPKSKAYCYQTLHKQFYRPADIRPDRIYTFQTERGRYDEEAERYEDLIERLGGIDLAVLGIGRNGHVGFNEPGSNADSGTRVVNLHDKTVKQSKRYLESLDNKENIPTQGVTLGIKTLLKSRNVLLIANGREKREIVEKTYKGRIGPDIPASYFQNHTQARLVIDQACFK
ncbi:MAG TPA: glucosamine-6-phosphate deaminase [Bacillales bacterium]|nr:glucosamine-6-phosphate deaminase [Bacillales bacterium]